MTLPPPPLPAARERTGDRWGHGWLLVAPHPPPHVTDALDGLLARHDPPLHAHLAAVAAAPGLLGWVLLSSLFSEVRQR